MLALMFGPSVIAVLSLGVFIRPIETDFAWSRTQVTLASSVVAYTIMVISPVQGWLVDRFGARRTMLPCLPLFAASVALMYFLPPVPWLYCLAWMLLPISGIGLFPLSYLRVVSSWFDQRLGLALGIANAGIGFGGAVLPLVLSQIIPAHGWRTGFLTMAILALVVATPAVLFFVRENPHAAKMSRRTAHNDGASFGEAVRTRSFALLAGIFVLLGLINTALFVHQIPLLVDAGVTPQRAAVVQSVFGLFVIVGRLSTGLLIDFFAPPLVMMVMVLGASAACVAYSTGVTSDVVFLCAAALGMVLGAEFDVLSYLLKRYFGMKSFGKLYGFVFAVFQLGAGAGAALLPMMRHATGSYAEGLLVFAGATLVCAFLLLVLHRLGRHDDGNTSVAWQPKHS